MSATPAGEVFEAILPPAGRPGASALSAPPPEPARAVYAGAGVHRLVFVPGLASAAEVADALAAVPDAAVCMGGFVGPDTAEVEFVEFGEVDPAAPVPWRWPPDAGPVVLGAAGPGKSEIPALAGRAGAAAVSP